MTLKPRQPVPALEFDTVGNGRWTLVAQKPQNFTMVVFYRGLHCPVCRKYTSELNGMIGEFDKRGVSTVITSTDAKGRAEEAKTKWGLPNLTVGYGVSIDKARERHGRDRRPVERAVGLHKEQPRLGEERRHALLGVDLDHAFRAPAFRRDRASD